MEISLENLYVDLEAWRVKYKEIEGKVTQRVRNVAIYFKPYRPTSSLLNLRTDSDNGYGFLQGAEERKK